jgi:predicted nucleic acid-binding protein
LIFQVLLDTNAVSDFAESERAIMKLPAGVRRLALPVFVVGAYRFGIAHARNTRDYHRRLERLVSESRVPDSTEETAHHCASIRTPLPQIGKTFPVHDVRIAALGRQHDLPVLGQDHHFDVVPGIRRLNW